MLIKEVMSHVWKEKNDEYEKLIREAALLDAEEIYQRVRDMKMTYYTYPGTYMNLITCSVCSYRLDNHFAGCSMCNYENEDLQHKVYMTLLRKKNKDLYIKAIVDHFHNTRGEQVKPDVYELFSGYDIFSEKEFPEEVFEQMLGKNKLFIKKPLGYIFEARASSITQEKLNTLKKYTSDKDRIYIEFGVEVADEWIRNHWLNKGLSNDEIINAIQSIHRAGFYACADVLLGIPGLTEEQSINHFIQTIVWLNQLGVDQFVILPLNRKELTLQGILHKHLSEDRELVTLGLAQRDHTGIPWLTTVIKALDMAFDIDPAFVDKFSLAQVFAHQNSVKNETDYNKMGCRCNDIIRNTLWSYQNKRVRSLIKDARIFAESDRHECHKDYTQLLERQKQAGDVPGTMATLMKKLSECIWGKEYEKKYNQFKVELLLYGRK